MPIELVIFDLGRVLVKLCDNWKHAGQLAALPTEIDDLNETMRRALHEIVDANERGLLGHEEFCHQAATILKTEARHVSAVLDVYLLEMFPGVPQLLEQITATGCQTACLSNTNAMHWKLMTTPGNRCSLPMGQLQHHFASHLIGRRKPDSGIYAHVEQQTGVVGQDILFFDDVQENVQAARQRNWHAEQILSSADPVSQMRRHLGRLRVLP